ncbi:MAG: hypothetical protein RIR26_2139 [Pseudomonadota bacterium]
MKRYILLVPVISILASCGSEEKKTETPSPESAFVGTWATECISASASSFLKTTMVFNSDKTSTIELAGYSDSECSNKTFLSSSKYTFSVTGDGEQGSKVVQTTLTEIKSTYFEDSVIAVLNSTNQCESGTWTKGVETNCTNKKINSTSSTDEDAVQKAGNKSEALLKIEGTKLTSVTSKAVFTRK